MILKKSKQYYRTPALRSLPRPGPAPAEPPPDPRIWASCLEIADAVTAAEVPCRPDPSTNEAVAPANHIITSSRPSTAEPVLPAAPPPEDVEQRRKWEIDTALEAALSPEVAQSFPPRLYPEDITFLLDRIFPGEAAINAAEGEPGEGQVFEISYDEELKCLVKNKRVDLNWLPAGLLHHGDQSGKRN